MTPGRKTQRGRRRREKSLLLFGEEDVAAEAVLNVEASLMGAAVGDGGEPLLVMELMGYGSLWDLLRNQSVRLDGDIVLQMLQVDSPLYPILSG